MRKKSYWKKAAAAVVMAAVLAQGQAVLASEGDIIVLAEEPAAEEAPAAEEVPAEEPVVTEAPVVEEPTTEEPTEEDPTVEDPAAEDPTTEEPTEENPTVTEAPTEGDITEEDPEETETPEEETYKTDFIYEDAEVIITAKATQEAQLPQNAELKAVKLLEGTPEYEEAKAASAAALGSDDTAVYTFYDVTFTVDGQKVEPPKGTTSIQIQFKTVQVSSEAAVQNVIHIEDTGNGKVVEDVTAAAEDGSNISSVDFAL